MVTLWNDEDVDYYMTCVARILEVLDHDQYQAEFVAPLNSDFREEDLVTSIEELQDYWITENSIDKKETPRLMERIINKVFEE